MVIPLPVQRPSKTIRVKNHSPGNEAAGASMPSKRGMQPRVS